MGGACRRAGGLAVVAGLLLLAACTGGRTDGGGPATSVPPTTAPERPPEAFYAVPDPLPPGPPGALIRALPIAAPTVVPDSRAWAVLYHSRDFDGRDVAVSGLVVAPPGAAPAGGRPVVVWGHGSVGLADRCAPSRGGVKDAFGGPVASLLQQGVVWAATDYQGLGTPGPARFAVGLSAGRAVLDAARAARGLDAGAGGRVVLHGHSEGGHAVLWAAELAPTYAPELQVLGVATSAPGAELAAGLRVEAAAGPATLTSGAMLLVVAWSDVYRMPVEVLTPAGRKAVGRVRGTCLQELMADPEVVAVRPRDLLTTPPWPALLARNTPGKAATPAPILLAQGADDDRVTPAVTRALVGRLCRLGDTVELRTYQGVGHFDVIEVAATDMVAWTGDRLTGRPARSTCRR